MNIAIHADRSRDAVVHGGELPWMPSPERGVERCMLERVGEEVALATSIVRYGPRTRFPSHVHALGEEFLVLSGTFSDQHGDYPEGSFVRNPPGSSHAPHSDAGCVIFVKLRQMQADEAESVRVYPTDRVWTPDAAAGVERAPLYRNQRISISLLRLAAGAELPAREVAHGAELFMVSGSVELLEAPPLVLRPWGWRRSAATRQPAMRSAHGALLWEKRGHL